MTDLLQRLVDPAETFNFGALSTQQDSPESVSVYFNYSLVGDYLNDTLLDVIIPFIANTADGLDEDVTSTFGGRRATDPFISGTQF
ncbi:hypothetical protein BH18ACT2_BH18ACT2_14500 [soil metagenome]